MSILDSANSCWVAQTMIGHSHEVMSEQLNTEYKRQKPHVLMRPSLSIDGNKWCALYGDNLQDGIAGFGNSPEEAMADFDKVWNEPLDYLVGLGYLSQNIPYCHGPCCPDHLGPKEGDPIIFQDGCTEQGRQMWCAVMPDFENLQESQAGFDGNPFAAVAKLRAALAKANGETK